MANAFHRQSVRRKIVYFGLIVALFTLALVVRKYDAYGMEAQAGKLEIREESLGDVEFLSSALRLSLFGSRGAVVCFLWADAQEKQKKHEWNQLEQRVRVLVKLQPHFISPWLFQSWNLAYNVSVEFDRVKDKYFYIARGINLLADGERKNRDNPEMRFFIGNYMQSKLGISDQSNTLRCLFQMSCIDPVERDPARFRKTPGGEIDPVVFEEFCRYHPHLVRRLRDHIPGRTLDRPEDIVEFLAENRRLPGRYEETSDQGPEGERPGSRLKPIEDRWPVLPPPPGSVTDPQEYTNDNELKDDFDSYMASRAWYSYAQDPVEAKRRRPRYMATILFQGYPARAQFYVAERTEQEGWFDGSGWKAEWTDFPAQPTMELGKDRNWAGEAWEKAFQMYRDHGERHGLYKDPEAIRALSPADLREFNYNRNLSNFAHFYYKADVERTRAAIAARKLFYEAEEAFKKSESLEALQLYEDPEAFGPPSTWAKDKATGWKRVLLRSPPEFRHDNDVEEDNYVIQRKYLRVVRNVREVPLKRLLIMQDFLTQGALPLGVVRLAPIHLPQNVHYPLPGPLDDTDDEGKPLLGADARSRVNSRVGPPPGEIPAAAPASPAPSSAPRGPRQR